ncbi:MAG: hypothetical protein AAF225_04695 [Pseudomonadota bacterium]
MSIRIIGGMIALTALMVGCETADGYLFANSSTVIGLKLEQSPTTNTPVADLGYVRSELAVVPTDRGACVEKGTDDLKCPVGMSAKNAPNVLMELRYSSILSANSSIYQRLAIGDIAVEQPGAAFMFAKSPRGELSSNNAEAVATALGADQARLTEDRGQTLMTCIGSDRTTGFDATQTSKRDAIVDKVYPDNPNNAGFRSLLTGSKNFLEFEQNAQALGYNTVKSLADAIANDPTLCN